MTIGNYIEPKSNRFACGVCGKSYLRKRHLQRHTRDECIDIPPRFSCDMCPSRFRRKYHMVRHLMSKHSVPAAIAQQTTGNNTRNSNGDIKHPPNGDGAPNDNHSGGENGSIGSNGSHHGWDSPIPENLSMPKHEYGMSPLNDITGFAYGGNVGNAVRISPVPGVAAVGSSNGVGVPPMPAYGLTGAITAISAAAAAIEEQAAAAAAAVAAAAAATGIDQKVLEAEIAANLRNHGEVSVKNEPVTPGEAPNVLDEEWKMKLSLQLISNSLLKERLMNQMPFAYKNN